mmetsp:Transcript_97064/g.301940  ORF Transcript_97064/g.301940 Transcript_97064/m.301940 type:complete len:310 (+) Transcript_97064:28-957(+)
MLTTSLSSSHPHCASPLQACTQQGELGLPRSPPSPPPPGSPNPPLRTVRHGCRAQLLANLLQHLPEPVPTPAIIAAAPVVAHGRVEEQLPVTCTAEDLCATRVLCKLPARRTEHHGVPERVPIGAGSFGEARFPRQRTESMGVRHIADLLPELWVRVFLRLQVVLDGGPEGPIVVAEIRGVVGPQLTEVTRVVVEDYHPRPWRLWTALNCSRDEVLLLLLRGLGNHALHPLLQRPAQLVEVPLVLPRAKVVLQPEGVDDVGVLRGQCAIPQHLREHRGILITAAAREHPLEADVREEEHKGPPQLSILV